MNAHVAVFLFSCLVVEACQTSPNVFVKNTDAGRMGTCRVYSSSLERQGLVFLFSDASGWSPSLEQHAKKLAGRGVVVVGVDLRDYLQHLSEGQDGCHYLVSEIEDTSKRLQREYEFSGYFSPMLAGFGAGGTLAYAALAQAPAATLAGAISIDPTPSLVTNVPLCEGAPAHPSPAGGFEYGSWSEPHGWWRISLTRPAPPWLAALTNSMGGIVLESSPDDALAAAVRDSRAVPSRDSRATLTARLPLIEYPLQEPSTVMAVIYSGDGGWRDLDKQIGERLVSKGVPVIGIDSLRYFWRRKTPDQVAEDLHAIVTAYRQRWHATKVALIGYSFGADILPFAVTRLPRDSRDAVVQISLLGLESTALFEFQMAGWFTDVKSDYPVLPELQQLDLTRVQCFYGEEEEDTLCRSPELKNAEVIRTSGGHHFDGDYSKLADLILKGITMRR